MLLVLVIRSWTKLSFSLLSMLEWEGMDLNRSFMLNPHMFTLDEMITEQEARLKATYIGHYNMYKLGDFALCRLLVDSLLTPALQRSIRLNMRIFRILPTSQDKSFL